MTFCSQICRLLSGRGTNPECQETLLEDSGAVTRPAPLENGGAVPTAPDSTQNAAQTVVSTSQLPEVGVAATGQTRTAASVDMGKLEEKAKRDGAEQIAAEQAQATKTREVNAEPIKSCGAAADAQAVALRKPLLGKVEATAVEDERSAESARLAVEEAATKQTEARRAEVAHEAAKMEAAAKAADSKVEEQLVAGEAKAEQSTVAAKAQDKALEAGGREKMVHEQLQEKNDGVNVNAAQKPETAGSTEHDAVINQAATSAGSPEISQSSSTNSFKKTSNEAEKRIDPVDGRIYTFQELKVFYKGKYNEAEISKYWNDTCKPVGRKKAGGKGNPNKPKSFRK